MQLHQRRRHSEIDSNVDLNNPANFGWAGGRVNIQDEKRETETKGGRGA